MTNQKKINEIIAQQLLTYKHIDTSSEAFMEELILYRITKSAVRQDLENYDIKNIKLFTHGKRGLIFTGTFPEPKKALRASTKDLPKNYTYFSGKKDLKISIKVQRTDIDASGTVNHEANVLKEINEIGIGPKLICSGMDYFVYEFVNGMFITEFLEKAKKDAMLEVIQDVLFQMRKLDELRYTKEEMTHPHKHILVDKTNKAVLLDFERCKKSEKPHNVTQFCSYLTGGATYLLEKKQVFIDEGELRELCGDYVTANYTLETYNTIVACIAKAFS